MSFDDDEKIVENAKKAVSDINIRSELFELENNYIFMIKLIENAESITYTVEDAIQDIRRIKICNDVCEITEYIQDMKAKNNLFSISSMLNEEINPDTYSYVLKLQATSISVERSFSMLNKLNAKDRNFNDESIKKYAILNYNLKES